MLATSTQTAVRACVLTCSGRAAPEAAQGEGVGVGGRVGQALRAAATQAEAGGEALGKGRSGGVGACVRGSVGRRVEREAPVKSRGPLCQSIASACAAVVRLALPWPGLTCGASADAPQAPNAANPAQAPAEVLRAGRCARLCNGARASGSQSCGAALGDGLSRGVGSGAAKLAHSATCRQRDRTGPCH